MTTRDKCGADAYTGIFVPQCMSGAVYGKSRCTCDGGPMGRPFDLYDKVRMLEERVRDLERSHYPGEQK